MNVNTLLISYMVGMALIFVTIKLRAFIKLGVMVVFRKRHIAFIFDDSRNLQIHAVQPNNKSIEIDESIYFLSPSKVWFMKIMEKMKLKKPARQLKEEKTTTYNVQNSNAYRFNNAPISVYIKDNPEPVDMYNLQGKTDLAISGKALAGVIKQSQIAGNLDILAKIQQYIPYVVIVGVILALGLVYFVMFGLTPQIAAGSGSVPPLAL